MKISSWKHVNTECITLGVSIDWNVDLAIEIDFLIWTIDIVLIKSFRRGRKRSKIQTLKHLYTKEEK